MVPPIGRSPNPLHDLGRGSNEVRMVRLDGEALNQLFSTLAAWNVILKDTSLTEASYPPASSRSPPEP